MLSCDFANKVEIWDESGNVVATVGEPIAMGGEGRPPQDHILKEPLPEACVGPFWYMGEILPKSEIGD